MITPRCTPILPPDYRWINYSFKEKFPHYSRFYTNLGWYPSYFNLILFKAHIVFQGTNSGYFSTGGSEEQNIYFGLALSWSLDMPDHMHTFETAVQSSVGSRSSFPGKGQLKACPRVEEWMSKGELRSFCSTNLRNHGLSGCQAGTDGKFAHNPTIQSTSQRTEEETFGQPTQDSEALVLDPKSWLFFVLVTGDRAVGPHKRGSFPQTFSLLCLGELQTRSHIPQEIHCLLCPVVAL